jgi:small subunit ribosomal protein S11
MGKRKTAEPIAAAEGKAPAAKSAAKKVRNLQEGCAYVNATYNNTVVSVTDISGNVLAWATAGSLGFSGPKKATPFAASKIVAVVAEKLKGMGVKTLDVYVKGIGGGRDSAIRSLANQGFELRVIKDVTPVPHNGPRPAKVRRV